MPCYWCKFYRSLGANATYEFANCSTPDALENFLLHNNPGSYVTQARFYSSSPQFYFREISDFYGPQFFD